MERPNPWAKAHGFFRVGVPMVISRILPQSKVPGCKCRTLFFAGAESLPQVADFRLIGRLSGKYSA
jgi:hypothetical protein